MSAQLLLPYRRDYYHIQVVDDIKDAPENQLVVAACKFKPLPVTGDSLFRFHLDPKEWTRVLPKIEPEHIVLVQNTTPYCRQPPPDLSYPAWWCVLATNDGYAGCEDNRILLELPQQTRKLLKKRWDAKVHTDPGCGYYRSKYVKRLYFAPDWGSMNPCNNNLIGEIRRQIADERLFKAEDNATIRSVARRGDQMMVEEMKNRQPLVSPDFLNDLEEQGIFLKGLPSQDELIDELGENTNLLRVLSALNEFPDGISLRRCKGYIKFDIDMDDQLNMVPFLRRLGHSVHVMLKHSDEYEYNVWNVCINHCGHALSLAEVIDDSITCRRMNKDHDVYFYGRTFRQSRQLAILKCIPRLLGWLRAARIELNDPVKHPEKMEEAYNTMQAEMAECAKRQRA